jgi:hypothetical protein
MGRLGIERRAKPLPSLSDYLTAKRRDEAAEPQAE